MAPIISKQRAAYVDGLRAFADFLESTEVAVPSAGQQMLLPVHTNDAVEAFAAEHGLTVQTSEDGAKKSAVFTFGPIEYKVYGYRNFAEHCDQTDEATAHRWAARHGVELPSAAAESVSA